MIPDATPVPTSHVSTGDLPTPEVVWHLMEEAYKRFGPVGDGAVADYIPALAGASPDWFGICVAGVAGGVLGIGDHDRTFSIQSVSKPFVFALVCEALGPDTARAALGVNNTGLAFDSVMAIELNAGRPMNPMVNAGAITTTSLVPGADPGERWAHVYDGLSRFAGRPLAFDEDVYRSEAATNRRNRGIAHLLDGYGHLDADPLETIDLYTRQCSLLVTSSDLAVMGATLADGGVNPVTGERVVGKSTCQRVLAVLATAGLYERSGDWLFDCGLPGKSGVSGGILTIAPGKGGVGVYSPPLDAAGNSVRGQLVTRFLSEALGLNLFTSAPYPTGADGDG
jgi:glutaminase